MTLSENRQHESTLKVELKRILLEIKEIKKWGDWEFNGKIAEEFKVQHGTAWKITKNWQATEQFFQFAKIYLENLNLKEELESLKRNVPGKSLVEQVADLVQRNQDLEAAVLGKYPQHRPSHHSLNEANTNSESEETSSDADLDALVEEAVDEAAADEPDKPPGNRKRNT